MTAIYITLAVIILWLIGVDIRYYQISKKIKIMHNTDKNLLELVNTIQKVTKDEKEKEENKSKPQRNNKKRIIKKVKRVRAPKVSS